MYCLGLRGQSKPDSTFNYSTPKFYTIAGITVSGDNVFEKTNVISLTGLSMGQEISIPGDEITLAIHKLWDQKLFSDVKIILDKVEGSNAYLNIYVISRPRLSKYNFIGVNKSSANNLKDEVKLESRTIVTEQIIAQSIQRIQEYYAEKGFRNVKVTITKEPDLAFGTNSIQLHIKIDKGNRIKINEISFDGVTAFKEKKLRSLLKKTKRKQKGNIFRTSKLDEDLYEEDKQKLISYYQNHGYKDARIVSDSIYSFTPELINIHIKLFEGNQYHYRSVEWSGNTKYENKVLSGILGIKKGDVYNPGLLENRLYINQAGLDVTSLYMDDGYLFFNVNPVETKIEDDSIDLEIRIYEGPQATINNVTVSGNTKTHDHVILREIRTRPGEKFSRADIIRTQRELGQLGYFDPEKMNVIPKPDPQTGTVDLEYVVEEKPSDQIELSGGWGAKQLVGVLGLTLNNFSARNVFKKGTWQGYPSGDGQKLSIRAQSSGFYYQSYNISFTEPWFGGRKPNSFSSGVYFTNYVTNGKSKSDPTREQFQTLGASAGVGKRLKWPDDYWQLYQSLNAQRYKFFNYPLLGSGSDTGTSSSLYVLFSLSRSSTNDIIFPTSGSQLSFSVQATPPFSYVRNDTNYEAMSNTEKFKITEYHKWKINAVNYFDLNPTKTISKRHFVIKTGTELGFLGLYNKRIGITPFERFDVGGDGLNYNSPNGKESIRFRGYESPSSVFENATIYSLFNAELRYPLTTSNAARIYGLAFVEAGNGWSKFNTFNPYAMKRSAGVGFRIFLPMLGGLLGFDAGYGFDPPVGSLEPSGWHFHFYIGQP